MKTLVAYFSASAVTKAVAETLAKAANADVFEIEPTSVYTKEDLDYRNPKSRCSVEMNDSASRPPIAKKVADMANYDVVFVGFPIWWGVAPRIIDTFLESYDFSGKTIVPFATSGGSGIGKAEEAMKPLCASASWKTGKLLDAKMTQDKLAEWVKSL